MVLIISQLSALSTASGSQDILCMKWCPWKHGKTWMATPAKTSSGQSPPLACVSTVFHTRTFTTAIPANHNLNIKLIYNIARAHFRTCIPKRCQKKKAIRAYKKFIHLGLCPAQPWLCWHINWPLEAALQWFQVHAHYVCKGVKTITCVLWNPSPKQLMQLTT